MNRETNFTYGHILGKHGISLSYNDGGATPGGLASPCARAVPNEGKTKGQIDEVDKTKCLIRHFHCFETGIIGGIAIVVSSNPCYVTFMVGIN